MRVPSKSRPSSARSGGRKMGNYNQDPEINIQKVDITFAKIKNQLVRLLIIVSL